MMDTLAVELGEQEQDKKEQRRGPLHQQQQQQQQHRATTDDPIQQKSRPLSSSKQQQQQQQQPPPEASKATTLVSSASLTNLTSLVGGGASTSVPPATTTTSTINKSEPLLLDEEFIVDLIIGSDHDDDDDDFESSRAASFFSETEEGSGTPKGLVEKRGAAGRTTTRDNKGRTAEGPPAVVDKVGSGGKNDDDIIAALESDNSSSSSHSGGGGEEEKPTTTTMTTTTTTTNTPTSPLNHRSRSTTLAEYHAKMTKTRLQVGLAINHEHAQLGILIVIMINSFMMGVATLPWVEDNPHIDDIFNKVDRGCLVIFTIEVALQLYFRAAHFFTEAWLVFDFSIVVLSWWFEQLQIVRAFRIFRAFRLFSRVRPLRNLVTALAEVASAASAICFLLTLVVYVYAVLFTELFKDLNLSKNYFKTLDASLFTCMELLTMDNWGELSREVMEHKTWAWAPITMFIGKTGLIIANIFVAVICDAVSVADTKLRNIDLGIQRRDSSGELTYTPKSPEEELYETQVRVDAIQLHVDDMVASQKQVLTMLDQLGSDLARLRAARLEAVDRETQLRIELEQRKAYEQSMAHDPITRSPGIDRQSLSFVSMTANGFGGGGSGSGGTGGFVPSTPGRARKSLFTRSDSGEFMPRTPGRGRKSLFHSGGGTTGGDVVEKKKNKKDDDDDEDHKPMLGLSVHRKPARIRPRRGSHSPRRNSSKERSDTGSGRNSRRGTRRIGGSLAGLSISLHGGGGNRSQRDSTSSIGSGGGGSGGRQERGITRDDSKASRSSMGSGTSGDSKVGSGSGGGGGGEGENRRRLYRDASRSTQGSTSLAGSETTY